MDGLEHPPGADALGVVALPLPPDPSIRREPSDAAVLLVVFPVYAASFAIGFGTYCDALRRFTRYMTARGWARSPWAVELPIHALSAMAIYVGRIHRFNSWDFLQEPADVLARSLVGFTRPLAMGGIVVVFTCLTVGQAAMRILVVDRLRGALG